MIREIMQQALDALKLVYEQADFSNGVTDPTGTMDEGKVVIGGIVSDAIAALESELAKPNQEPYCWVQSKLNQGLFYKEKPRRIHTIPLYTAPPRKSEQIITPISIDQYERVCFNCGACVGKPWVGLTDKEIKGILDCGSDGLIDIKKAEQTLKDKNT